MNEPIHNNEFAQCRGHRVMFFSLVCSRFLPKQNQKSRERESKTKFDRLRSLPEKGRQIGLRSRFTSFIVEPAEEKHTSPWVIKIIALLSTANKYEEGTNRLCMSECVCVVGCVCVLAILAFCKLFRSLKSLNRISPETVAIYTYI